MGAKKDKLYFKRFHTFKIRRLTQIRNFGFHTNLGSFSDKSGTYIVNRKLSTIIFVLNDVKSHKFFFFVY